MDQLPPIPPIEGVRAARHALATAIDPAKAVEFVEHAYLEADARAARRQRRGTGGKPHRCESCRLFTGSFAPTRCQHCGFDPGRGFPA